VEVIDSVQDYLQLMKEIFDFNALKAMITGAGGGQKINILANSLSGGVYAGLPVCYLFMLVYIIYAVVYNEKYI